jgi:formylglycine-generating enzyme required for sulfatase activity
MTIPSQLLRGGSWNSYPRFCRSAHRLRLQPDYALDGIGFRVVCLPHEVALPRTRMLLRGGSWFSNPRDCRSAYRDHYGPDDAFLNVGFRVVCLPPSASNSLKT